MDIKYFTDLGLSEEQATQAVNDYNANLESATSGAVNSKNTILSEKKQLQTQFTEAQERLAALEAQEKERLERTQQDEIAALFNEGKIDEAKSRFSESILKNHNESLSNYKKEVEAEKNGLIEQLSEKDKIIQDYLFEKNFNEVALKHPLFNKTPGAMQVLKDAASRDFDFKDNKFSFKKEGELINGEPVTPENWLNKTVKEQYPFLFNVPQGAGNKTDPVGNGEGKIDNETYAKMTSEQKKEALRKGLI